MVSDFKVMKDWWRGNGDCWIFFTMKIKEGFRGGIVEEKVVLNYGPTTD